jgi:peptidoglycan/LPS O-acetylase OafA/YrhL
MTPTRPLEKTHYVANIDFLRAVAVLSVVAHHVFATTGFQVPYLDRVGGYIGVQLFFILSGYLISESATKHSMSEYALHRFFRIFPPYWVAMLGVGFFLGGMAVANKAMDRPLGLMLSVLNLQQLYAGALLELDILHVTWTLTVEMFWYLLAPLALIAYRRFAWPTLFMLAMVSVLWSMAATRHQLDALYVDGFSAMTQAVMPGQYEVMVGSAFPAQMVFFGMGAMVYRYRDRAFRIGTTPLLICMFVCLAMLQYYVADITHPPIPIGLGLTAFFILMMRAPAIESPFFVHIGKISYSIYLLHFPIILLCFHKLGFLGNVHLVITCILIFLFSHLLYTRVERPCMAFARRFRQPALPSNAAAA